MLSLRSSLPRSAIGWSIPAGPTRLGPYRTWKRPIGRRSIQVMRAKTSITRFTSTADLITVTMKPSGIGILLGRRCQAAGPEMGERRCQPDDAGAEAPVDHGRPV